MCKGREYGGQLVHIRAGVDELGGHDDVRGLIHSGLRVVAVVDASVGVLHDACLWIGEAVLRLGRGNPEAELVRLATLGLAIRILGTSIIIVAAPALRIAMALTISSASASKPQCCAT